MESGIELQMPRMCRAGQVFGRQTLPKHSKGLEEPCNIPWMCPFYAGKSLQQSATIHGVSVLLGLKNRWPKNGHDMCSVGWGVPNPQKGLCR